VCVCVCVREREKRRKKKKKSKKSAERERKGRKFFSPPNSPTALRHSRHLHLGEHGIDAWKHSQYFLRQCDLRQLHPFACEAAPPPTPPAEPGAAALPLAATALAPAPAPPPPKKRKPASAAEPEAGATTVRPSSNVEITCRPMPRAPGTKNADGPPPPPPPPAPPPPTAASAAAAAVPGCATLGLKALGLRSRMVSIARCLSSSWAWLFWHLAHWHESCGLFFVFFLMGRQKRKNEGGMSDEREREREKREKLERGTETLKKISPRSTSRSRSTRSRA